MKTAKTSKKKEVEPVKAKRTTEFVLGLLGGLIGFVGSVIVLGLGKLVDAISTFTGEASTSILSSLGLLALVCSVIGILGSALVGSKPKLGGALMIVSAIGGVIAVSYYYALAFILLLIAGLMGLFRKRD